MAPVTPSALSIIWLLFVSSTIFPPAMYAAELSLVVSGLTTLQLSPSLIIEKSPGLKLGTKVKCERVQIHGLPRLKHLNKFANSVKVKVSYVSLTGRPPNVEICFHRNLSLGMCMCPQDRWERLTEGIWVKSMSPFDYKLLDIRMVVSYSESLQVSLAEEFFMYRLSFLFLGIVMMTLASSLSKSLTFYYSGAMAVGVFLVILIVLFQGMKLLPTGRRSSLAIFIYSSFVGLGSFLLRYVPRFLRFLLVEIGLSEDMYNPLAIFLLVFLVISGAWLGFWVVRKLVLTEDSSIDVGVSHFVTWSIRIVASVMILQSSVDPLLAAEALVCGIFVSSMLKSLGHSKVIHHVYKYGRNSCRNLSTFDKSNHRKSVDPHASRGNASSVSKPFSRSPYSPGRGSAGKSPTKVSNSETFYSTFHDNPDRREFSKDEWDKFTRESTRKALEGLVSSHDFSKWAVTHADRLTLAPRKESADKRRRWFSWF